MEKIFITSESVTEGHPDKMCDQISDGILDAFLTQDQTARVAVETLASDKIIFIAGEISSTADVNIAEIARQVIRDIGYTREEYGLDYANCIVVTNINLQSTDISLGVNQALEYKNSEEFFQNSLENLGAGDQGMMYGYACRETADYMPLPIHLAHRLAERLSQVRKEKVLPYLRPDGKSQVTIEYDNRGNPMGIENIVIAAQHAAEIKYELLREDIIQKVIQPMIPAHLSTDNLKLYVNPTGRFVIGGPKADTGLTGRKIIVDTYGGFAKHGGGAFSGKDPTKVDRSAAYMARYAAKNIVAAELADRCELGLAYAIGMARPIAINLNTFGTEKIDKDFLAKIIKKCFDFRPGAIIKNLRLARPIYKATAAYGHFGRESKDFPWEELNKITLLRTEAFGI